MERLAKRAQKELEILYKISHALAQQTDLSHLLQDIMDIIENEMQMQRVTLAMRRPDSDIFEIHAASGLSREEQKRGLYQLGEGITGRVAQTAEAMAVMDITKDPRFLNRTKTRGNEALSFLCVPIIHQNIVIGTMSMDRAPIQDEQELKRDLAFLKLLASLLAEAVSRIREVMQERSHLFAENKRLRQQLDERYYPKDIIGNCSAMRQVYEQISQVANSSATVLIRGESGTGKELVARAIHSISPRKDKAFICVNCAALPESLIESELFGHEKGSFTGAHNQRKGRFELAQNGTIFLDEIGELSQAVQVRLLRILQERTFERVGGTETINLNVRIIAATNRNLEDAISENHFREDLYYRLNVFPIILPPLRERRSDIILLADHFIQKYNTLYSREIKRISTAAIDMMMQYHWPGNVRELENCIERSILMARDDVIHSYTLPPSLQTSEETGTAIFSSEGTSLKDLLDAYEKELIIDALKKNNGIASAAAKDLHTTQRIINYAIKRLNIQPQEYKSN